MGADSKIEWTHHTFNPWRGCTKVSEGCKFCYALDLSKRNPAVLGIWGPKGTRVVAAESYWRQPLKWNKAAEQAGERHRVFCASLADVFEGPETMPSGAWPAVEAARRRLFELILDTPHLDWLLLTKRPQNVLRYSPMRDETGRDWHRDGWPANIWLGTSVENQAAADERIPHLLRVPARVRFLSCEPLLGPVDVSRWLLAGFPAHIDRDGRAHGAPLNIHWLIAGGESGGHARPMHPAWARSLRDQCQAAGVAFHFKQHGEWMSEAAIPHDAPANSVEPEQARWMALDGSTVHVGDGVMRRGDALVCRVGKKAAGRSLDGRTWDEVPL